MSIEIGPDYIAETLDVPSDLADLMKEHKRRFNETLTDWADRVRLEYGVCRGTGYTVTPCPQAEFGDRTNHDPS
jgi:hypothetical protein